jgi:PAS domain S-box-containing protein
MPSAEALLAFSRSPEVEAFLTVPRTAVYIVRRDLGHDGEIVWASDSLEDVLGIRPADVVGRNAWTVFVAPEDVHEATRYSARMMEGDLTAWAPLLRRDGTKVWVRFDALNREGGVVIALRPEPDRRRHHFHGFRRPLGLDPLARVGPWPGPAADD